MKIACLSMGVVAVMALAPRPAVACTCDASRAIPAYPRDGAENVPLDALLWTSAVGLWELDRVWVVDDAAPTVPVEGAWTEIALDLPSARTFRPARSWKAQTTYSLRLFDHPPEVIVELEGEEALAQYEWVVLRFTTGTSLYGGSVDISAPSYRVTRFGLSGTGTCSVSPYNIEVEVQAPHTGHLLVIDRIDDDVAPPSNGVVTYFAGTPHQEIVLGHNLCHGGWPGVAHGDRATFRFGTYDVTGVVHWFPRPLTIEIPERVEGYGTGEVEEPVADDDDDDDDGGGCVSVKGRSSGGLLGLSLTACALLPLRRRRARTTTTVA